MTEHCESSQAPQDPEQQPTTINRSPGATYAKLIEEIIAANAERHLRDEDMAASSTCMPSSFAEENPDNTRLIGERMQELLGMTGLPYELPLGELPLIQWDGHNPPTPKLGEDMIKNGTEDYNKSIIDSLANAPRLGDDTTDKLIKGYKNYPHDR